MRAVEISRPGGPEVLRVVQRPKPAPAAGELLIRVAAAGVNGHDLRHRLAGSHSVRDGESDLPGLEVAGEVVAVGPGVSGWASGDHVVALLRGGGYAEYAVAVAQQCLPVPDGLDLRRGASLPESFFTAWSNLVTEANLTAGETVLIHGGGSGVGVAAIQIARARGATVYTTAGSEDKCRSCREIGAALAVNYRTEPFETAVLATTEGRGVDVVLDMVGGPYVSRDIACLAPGGRLMLIAAKPGESACLPVDTVIRKQLTLTGTLLRERSDTYKSRVRDELLATIWPLLSSGIVRPVVDSVHPLSRVQAAHRRMESRLHFGKIVLDVAQFGDEPAPGQAEDESAFMGRSVRNG